MAIKAETGFSLKDDLFNRTTVRELADGIVRAHPDFQHQVFVRDAMRAFPTLELKARIDHLVALLGTHLPDDYEAAINILTASLPARLDPARTDDDFGRYIWVVPGEFAAAHGCHTDALEQSLGFLRETTQRFSAENAIRPFLNQFPAETLDFIDACATDDNYHVRRLASEGTRPLLPWSVRVKLPQRRVQGILDRLHADPTRYVTRSVANHLNDIAKSSPDTVVRTLRKWHKQEQQAPEELAWMTRHALRTLVNRDDPHALALLGYPQNPKLADCTMTIPDAVTAGSSLEPHITITPEATVNLLVTARVHFLKANGEHKPKVFRIGDVSAHKGKPLRLSKKISFKPMTTRTLYPGAHRIDLVVNGTTFISRDFELLP